MSFLNNFDFVQGYELLVVLLNSLQIPFVAIDVDIGSYHFFKAGKLGVAIVLRSTDKNKIEFCKSEIIKFVKDKEIQIV